jgi:hypothetical protein
LACDDRLSPITKLHMQNPNFLKKIFERQVLHMAALLLLLWIVVTLFSGDRFREGVFLDISTPVWFWLTIATAVAHQLYTWAMWRLELYGKVLSRFFGEHAFTLYKILFALFGLSRFMIVPLAISNRCAIEFHGLLQWGLSGLILIPALYLFYSVFRWFGLNRAAGLDHFRPEEAPEWGFVKEGIFRYTSNGMYLFGFLILWVPGMMLESPAALLAAAFSHLYIWVHYFCTEKPDMETIYGGRTRYK